MPASERLTILQYGDYAEAYQCLKRGGAESYRDQAKSVFYVEEISKSRPVHIISICKQNYDLRLNQNLHTTGINFQSAYNKKHIVALLEESRANLFICKTPHIHALSWASDKRIPTLPIFADTFDIHSISQFIRNLRLRRIFRNLLAPAVANHGKQASLSLKNIGVKRSRRLTWDMTPLVPITPPIRSKLSNRTLKLFYIGALIEEKGIGDLIRAVALLVKRGNQIELSVAGDGDTDKFKNLVKKSRLEQVVTFKGKIKLNQVIPLMRKSDMVVVPSQPVYAEGLPNTIFEAMAAGTPLLVSRHPAYCNTLIEGKDVSFFEPKKPLSLANSVDNLKSNYALYETLTDAGADRLEKLYVGTQRHTIIDAFLDDPYARNNWPSKLLKYQK